MSARRRPGLRASRGSAALLLGLGTVAAFCGCERGQEAAAPSAPVAAQPSGPVPRAIVDEPTFQFGFMQVGEEGRHVFHVRNTGAGPLQLKLGPTTCKCTLSNLARDQVPPGESAEVELVWTIKDERPKFHQEAVLETNDPVNSVLLLTVEGEVVAPLVFLPASTWVLPDVDSDRPVEFEGMLISRLADRFDILRIESSHAELLTAQASPLPAEKLRELNARSGYAIRVTLAPGFPVGPFSGALTAHTNLAGDTAVAVAIHSNRPGTYTVAGPLWSAQGNFLSLGTFPRDEGKRATVSLFVNDPPDDFRLMEVSADPPTLDVTLAPDPGFKGTGRRRRYWLTFDVPAAGPAAARDAEHPAVIKLRTNHPGAETLTLQVRYNAI